MSKWFLLGFGIRAGLAVVVFLMMLWSFEAAMLYLIDLPTVLFLALVEMTLQQSVFKTLVGGDPYYFPMNVIGCLLWGGIFMLIPLARNMVFRVWRKERVQ